MVREAISKLYDMYHKIDRFKKITPGFGFFFKRYEVKGKVSFLLVVIEPPHFRTKGKLKDFEKVVNKSLSNNKLILPKDFRFLHSYLSVDFNKLITPRDEILNKIKRIIASLRLNFFEYTNMKFSFIRSMFPEIIVYDTITDKGQFAFYFNIVNLSEDGLILAHERQLNFLYEQIENGVNPTSIVDTDLPDLRSGNTAFSFSRNKDRQKSGEKKGSVKKFKDIVSKKRFQEDIEEELDHDTVIDFNPSKRSDDAIKNEKKMVKRGLFGQPLPNIKKNKKIIPKPVSKPKPQPLESPIPHLVPSSPSIEDQTIITKQSNLADIDELEKKIDILEQENVVLEELKDRNDLLVSQISQITDELTTKLEEKDNELKNLKIELEEEKKIKEGLELEIQKIYKEKDVAFEGIEEQIQALVDENSSLLKSLEEIEFKRKELELSLEQIEDARNKDEERNNEIIVALKKEIQILNKKINNNKGE
ncbi:MAG: hypothetical protein ACTSQ5_11350 [Promethearchaeota archaeon]